MASLSKNIFRIAIMACLVSIALTGCKASGHDSPSTTQPPLTSTAASAPPQAADEAPLPEKSGGFDGKRAFAHVAKQVSFGPHPSGSPAIAQVQDYLLSELKSYGCNVEMDAFGADTPVGRLPMENILVKIPGEKPSVILLGTHYDTKRLDNFVGADDGGSSTAGRLRTIVMAAARWRRALPTEATSRRSAPFSLPISSAAGTPVSAAMTARPNG